MLPTVIGAYVDRRIRGLPLVNEEDRLDEGQFRSLLSLIREVLLALFLVGASTNSCRGCALP